MYGGDVLMFPEGCLKVSRCRLNSKIMSNRSQGNTWRRRMEANGSFDRLSWHGWSLFFEMLTCVANITCRAHVTKHTSPSTNIPFPYSKTAMLKIKIPHPPQGGGPVFPILCWTMFGIPRYRAHVRDASRKSSAHNIYVTLNQIIQTFLQCCFTSFFC